MTYHANPPKSCDLCKAPIAEEFSDAFVPLYGMWGNVGPECVKDAEIRYGTGLGQRYVMQDDGRYYKVEG